MNGIAFVIYSLVLVYIGVRIGFALIALVMNYNETHNEERND